MTPSLPLKHVALILALGASVGAHAQVLNGSFETDAANTLAITGWNKVGHGYVATTTNYQDPTQGTKQAVVATALDGTYNEPAGTGVSGATAETALGLAAGRLQGVGNGQVANVSAIYQTIRLNVGDRLLFSAALLTNQVYNTGDAFSTRPSEANNDFGFLSTSLGSTSSVVKLADMFDGYASTGSSASAFTTAFRYDSDVNDPFLGEGPYRSYTYTATAAGDYRIGFGAANAYTGTNPNGINSALLVDNVRVVAAVPEPATIAALGLGLAALLRRRKAA